jgi:hypothetical protein
VIFWNAGILTRKEFFVILEAREQKSLENERKETKVKSKKHTYERDLPRRLYTFFACYDDERSAPSFQKFARAQGMTTEELLAFRKHKDFERACRECNEIRRDYLIDRALTKRFDASFTKYLLDGEQPADTEDSSLTVTLEVLN